MSRQHDALLKRMCQNNDTLEKARSILHTASIKTAPGSGYELGQGAPGLPAICAYVAAEQLGDNDIDEKLAQSSSCLKPRLFKTTLNTVRSALAAAEAATSPQKTRRGITYYDLVNEQRIGRKGTVVEWMQKTERTLMANPEMRRRYGRTYDTITVAVFCWTWQIIGFHGKQKKADTAALRDRFGVSRDQFDELTDALHDVCKEVAKTINNDMAALRTQSTPSKPALPKTATTPSKQISIPPPLPAPSGLTPSRAVSKSPSKSALRAPSADLSPTKTPSHKRKVAFGPIAEEDEDEFDALATPSKRQKFSSPLKPLPTATPRASSRLASKATQAAGDDDNTVAGPSTPRRPRTTSTQPSSTHSSRSVRSSRAYSAISGSAPSTPSRSRMSALPTVMEVPEVPRRRFRPVFVDQQQWLKGDARLERELKPWTERWHELVKKAGGDVWKAASLTGTVGAGV